MFVAAGIPVTCPTEPLLLAIRRLIRRRRSARTWGVARRGHPRGFLPFEGFEAPGVHVIGAGETPGLSTCRPGLITLPLRIVGPMSTLSGPTLGGTNVMVGGGGLGGPDAGGLAGALAPATGVAMASMPAAAAAAE
jgi:hypothetical protein